MAKSKSSQPAKKPVIQSIPTGEKKRVITVINQSGESQSMSQAVWNNLPQTQRDKFKLKQPEEVKKLTEKENNHAENHE